MSLEFNNPLYIGDKDSALKADVSQLKQDVGDLSQLDTADKSSLVNALNEALDSTLNGASRNLDNLSDVGNDKLRSLNAYANEGELLTDPDGLAFVKKYAHSTFDRSKFTVVGSPTITDDGIASGLSSTNWLRCSVPELINATNFEIDIEFAPTATTPDFPFILTDNAGATYGLSVQYWNGVIRVRSNSADNVVTFSNAVVNNNYRVNLKSNGTITLYTNGNYTETKNLDVSTMLSWSGVIELGNRNGSPSNSYFTGSIDLKQFSITIDGVEVFSGNKTGIDTIKPDDYTVVGTPTISADGIASGFSVSNYLSKSNAVTIGSSGEFHIDFEFDSASSSSLQYIFDLYNPQSNEILLRREIGANAQGLSSFKCLVFVSGAVIFNEQLPTADVGKGYIEYKNGVYTFALNNEAPKTLTSSTKIVSQSCNLSLGCRLATGTESDALTTGSIDLNAFKIYVNGDLVYQPCLKIPFTEGKTGSKIVDSYYRDRVNDMADQFGYANYYTLQDKPKGDYVVVGTPTISSDFVASGFSSSSYLRTIQCKDLNGKSWRFRQRFYFDTSRTGATCIINLSGTWASQGEVGIDGSQNLRFEAKTGDASESSAEGTKINLTGLLTTNGWYTVAIDFNISTGVYTLSLYNDNNTLLGSGTWTATTTDKQLYAIATNSTNYIRLGYGSNLSGTPVPIDLKEFKIYVDNKLAYEAVIEPNFTLPQVELYGLIGQRTLRDSYRNGINYWELYSNRDLEQGGSCTSGVEVTFPKPFADTNYVLSVPYSAKSATAFTPTQTGDWIAKGKGVL